MNSKELLLVFHKIQTIGKYSNGAGVLVGNKWIIVGGIVQMDQCNDIFVIDLETFNCEKKPGKTAKGKPPGPLESHTAVLMGDKIYVFGGYVGAKRSSKLFEYEIATNTWKEIAGKQGENLAERANHSAVVSDGAMYIFGGTGIESEPLPDLWKYTFATETWDEIKPKEEEKKNWPEARSGHSAVMNQDVMYIFGGNFGLTQETNDLQGFNVKTLKWNLSHKAERVQDADEKISISKSPGDKRISKDSSPRLKAQRGDSPKRALDQKRESSPSPRQTKKDISQSSPKQALYGSMKQKEKMSPVANAEILAKKREEIRTPIVVAMKNSIVMKATFTNKRRMGEYDAGEHVIDGKAIGNFPCGRDGYTMQLYKGQIFIFGGDRFQMAYNDLYSYTLA